MIFSRMVGGLGNQLFQLAATLKYRNPEEKVLISFLGNIHRPKRKYCLNFIFEKPNWLYFDDSDNLNLLTKIISKKSAALRFGTYLPLLSVNDRNFHSKNYRFFINKVLFLDGYFNQEWTFNSLKKAFSHLKLKPIKLNKENLEICRNDVVIHIRGGDFLKIKHLNICQVEYYIESIKYSLSKGYKSFKVISEDQKYGREIIKEIKNYFINLNISMTTRNSIKNDFNIIRSSELAILSNSTFSWWASFLSNSKKEFIVPSDFSLTEKRISLPNETIINL